MDNVSRLKFHSIGIVAANKELNSRSVEVVCIEHSPMLDGELTDNASPYEAEGVDASGGKYKDSVLNTASIKATWLPLGSSNRLTAPDVRRGETVAVYRFADADEYWWCTLLEDSTLRRLETVIYAFSGTSVEGEKLSAINSYFLEISTHNKLVHFHTSKANGEPYAYDIQINTAEGFIQIQDDDGNIFKLSSADEQLSIINKSGSVVEVNKKVINFASPDEVNIKTTNYNLDCTNSTVTATSSKLTADTHVSTATVTQNGSATTNGPSVMNGGIAMNAGAAGASKMVITGDIDINGNVTNNGKAIGSTHRHGNVTNGPDTSGVPV